MRMLTHIEVHSATSDHVVLAGFGEILVDMYALNINSYTLPTTTCPLALLLVSQSSGLVFLTPSWTRIWHSLQNDNPLEGILGSTTMGTPRNLNTIINHIRCYQTCFSCWRVELFPSHKNLMRYLHLKVSPCYEWDSYVGTTPQTIDLPLKLASGWLFQFEGLKYCANDV